MIVDIATRTLLGKTDLLFASGHQMYIVSWLGFIHFIPEIKTKKKIIVFFLQVPDSLFSLFLTVITTSSILHYSQFKLFFTIVQVIFYFPPALNNQLYLRKVVIQLPFFSYIEIALSNYSSLNISRQVNHFIFLIFKFRRLTKLIYVTDMLFS